MLDALTSESFICFWLMIKL